jgi:hypothetical protein
MAAAGTAGGEGSAFAYLVTSAADVVYELEDTETQLGRADSNDIVSSSALRWPSGDGQAGGSTVCL